MTISKLTLKQGEAKTITLTVKDQDGAAVDLSSATLLLGVKAAKTETAYKIKKEDAAFDKSQAGLGIVKVALTVTDTSLDAGVYIGELKCSWTGPAVEKSDDFYLEIKGAVTT